jgi:hypothetical protein
MAWYLFKHRILHRVVLKHRIFHGVLLSYVQDTSSWRGTELSTGYFIE